MSNDKLQFVKLSELVDDSFTIEKVYGYKWKKWDKDAGRMLISDKYEQGYRKVYGVVTDKGVVDLGAGQIGSLLEAVLKQGSADLIGRTFSVKSNGKSGIDVRYYFHTTIPQQQIAADTQPAENEEDFNLGDIPF